jgi:hypothetical protein
VKLVGLFHKYLPANIFSSEGNSRSHTLWGSHRIKPSSSIYKSIGNTPIPPISSNSRTHGWLCRDNTKVGAEGLRWATVTGSLETAIIAAPTFATAYTSPTAAEYEAKAAEYEQALEEGIPYQERGERMPPTGIAKLEYAIGVTGERLATPEAIQSIVGAAAGGFFLGAVAETQPLFIKPYRATGRFMEAK